jgi:hypothetical protein
MAMVLCSLFLLTVAMNRQALIMRTLNLFASSMGPNTELIT